MVNLSWTVEVDLVPAHYVNTSGKSILIIITSLSFKFPPICGTALFPNEEPAKKSNSQWLGHSDGRP